MNIYDYTYYSDEREIFTLKALILSGGLGTRLRPLTHTNAKQLIPIANKPILFYGIEAIRDAGITDIGIVVGDTKNEIKEAVGDGKKFGVKITYIEQEAPLGLAHAVKISKFFLKDSRFVMYLGDNLLKNGIAELVEKFNKSKFNCQIMLTEVDNPKMFGVAELSGDKVIRLVEKPKFPKSKMVLVGVYMFDSTIFDAVNKIKPSKRNELEITDAIQYLIDHKYSVSSLNVSGWWKDTGKLEDILEANRLILDTFESKCSGTVDARTKIIGKVVIQKNAKIINSVIRGPVIIGENCRIENSFIGPFTSIYHNTIIENSEVEHSIVLEWCKISDINIRIEDSLLGKNVSIYKTTDKPKAYRLMIGDSGSIGI